MDVEIEIGVKNIKLREFASNIHLGLNKLSEKNGTKVIEFFYNGFDEGLEISCDIELYQYQKIQQVSDKLLFYDLESRFEDDFHILYFNNKPIVKTHDHDVLLKFYDYLHKQLPEFKKTSGRFKICN